MRKSGSSKRSDFARDPVGQQRISLVHDLLTGPKDQSVFASKNRNDTEMNRGTESAV